MRPLLHRSYTLAILCSNQNKINKNFVQLYSSSSSQEWLKRQLNDPFVKRARYENYRARSAFKLLEIDDTHHIIKPGMLAIDLGAAPGSWTQVLINRSSNSNENKASENKSIIIGIDINAINPIIIDFLLLTLPNHLTKVKYYQYLGKEKQT